MDHSWSHGAYSATYLHHRRARRARALESGVLAEQFDPYSGGPISVSPLTWSHGTVMTTIVQYLLKHAQLTGKRAGIAGELGVQQPQ